VRKRTARKLLAAFLAFGLEHRFGHEYNRHILENGGSRARRDCKRALRKLQSQPEPTDIETFLQELEKWFCVFESLPAASAWEIIYTRHDGRAGRNHKLTFEDAVSACEEVDRRRAEGEQRKSAIYDVARKLGTSSRTIGGLIQQRGEARLCDEIQKYPTE
jgi:hypothetical protein